MLLNAALKLEATLALFLAWIIVFILPSGWASKPFLATPTTTAPVTTAPVTTTPLPDAATRARNRSRANAAARRLEQLSPAMPFATTCLVLAIAGAMLLRRRGMKDFSIQLGVRKAETGLEAHAWLIHDGKVILGGASMEGFTPLTATPPHARFTNGPTHR